MVSYLATLQFLIGGNIQSIEQEDQSIECSVDLSDLFCKTHKRYIRYRNVTPSALFESSLKVLSLEKYFEKILFREIVVKSRSNYKGRTVLLKRVCFKKAFEVVE